MTIPISVELRELASFSEWRTVCRGLLTRHLPPEAVSFSTPFTNGDLFSSSELPLPHPERVAASTRLRVPKAFPDLAKQVICHSDDARYALLYRLLWRLQQDRTLLLDESDPDVWSAQKMAQSVRRDSHKMKAFVRFRRIEDRQGEAFIAWFEPEHHVVERTAPFFAKRFAGMRWSIVTPLISAHWNGFKLSFGDGAQRSDCPNDDALEEHWRVYYSSIFNPARLKIKAMMAEMPAKYWRNLPESRLIPELARSAQNAQRAAPAGTAPSVTKARALVAAQPLMHVSSSDDSATSLSELSQALQSCTRCSLCQHATAAVPGEGAEDADLMIVGEQPGDQEDLAGKPFVGPAGEVLNTALEEAGIRRQDAWVTNAVKHFKHTIKGKRRLHQRPSAHEIERCRWWLQRERQWVSPRVVIALGATAARALTGLSEPIVNLRGQIISLDERTRLIVTFHPAYLLRLTSENTRAKTHLQFVEDLKRARSLLQTQPLNTRSP